MEFEGLTFVVQKEKPFALHSIYIPKSSNNESFLTVHILVLSFLSCSHRINNNAQQRLQNTPIVASFTTTTLNLTVKVPQ